MGEGRLDFAGRPWTEPRWPDHYTQSTPDVAGQISTSLARSKKANLSWDLAWRGVLRTLKWPHDHDDRHGWRALIDDEQWVSAVWKSAYLGRPSGMRGDMAMLRTAIEDPHAHEQAHAPVGQLGARGVRRAA